ncbi:MAG: hypothetical protein RBR78_05980 [Flavobacteriaceae bacterium]|jgi:hypothetical protein|nr:hypothetical protein [Flavobacteriaceae bacterium]
MQRILYWSVLGLLTLASCNKKEVLLTKSSTTIDSIVVDYTPIYFFFEKKGNDTLINVNRKNTISTTNWVFHVDKRLPLITAVNEIIRLQEKRENAVFHKNENAINFFSYTDTTSKKLAFIPFKNIRYKVEKPDTTTTVKQLYFDKKGNGFLNGLNLNHNDLKKHFAHKNDSIHTVLSFQKEISFGDYLAKWIEISTLNINKSKNLETHYLVE